MKKINTAAVVVISALLLAGCTTPASEQDTETTTTQVQENITDEQATAYTNDVILEQWDIVAIMETSKGDIKMKLYADEAPLTVTNFIIHAMDDYYKDTTFHRVIDDFMIQWGDPLGNGTGWESIYGEAFSDEFFDKIENLPGTISMANSGVNTNGSQFFINEANNSFLNGKHTVFGRVYEWMDVVDTITNVPLNWESPATAIVIKDVVIYQYDNGELLDYLIENKSNYIQAAQRKHDEMLDNLKNAYIQQRDAKIQEDINRIAVSGDVVEMKYEFSLDDGTIVESIMEEEFGGQVQIDGQNPLPGLNDVLKGMKIGETKTGTLAPADAYGEKTIDVPVEQLQDFVDAGFELTAGSTLPYDGGELEIVSANDMSVVINNPHPAAGQNLNYTVKVIYFVN